jgi:hypothetical protein
VKRERRGKEFGELTAPLNPPQGGRMPKRARSERLKDAALDYADANAEGDRAEYQRAWENLMDAAHEFVLHRRRGARAARADPALVTAVKRAARGT